MVRAEGMKIDAVVLSEGPGSYTGLRIGTSTAKGLCYGLDVPLIAVPTLAVLCEAAREHSAFKPSDQLCPMIDARRMEVYTALYSAEAKEPKARAVVVENEESLTEGRKEEEERTKELRDVYYFGDGAAKCQTVLTRPNWHFIPDIVPEAQYLGRLANERLAMSEEQIAYYEPYYLKEFIAAQSHVKGLK